MEKPELAGDHTTLVTDRDRCLHRLIEEQVKRAPDHPACIFEGERLSYGQLNHRANQLAHYLRKYNVGPDVLVGVCMERSIEMVVGLLAILKAGGAYVPLDPEYPTERLGVMIEDAQPPIVLTQNKFLNQLPPQGRNVFCVDKGWQTIAPESVANPDAVVRPENAAYAIYTSGSTGKPKGVVNTHEGILNRLLWMQSAYPLTSADRVLQKTPYSFDVSVWEFFWPLMTGATLVIARPGGHRDPMYLANLILREEITILHFVPSMLRAFLEAAVVPKRTSLRRVFCSGESLSADLQRIFFDRFEAELHNLYGPTEASVDVTYWDCRREDERPFVPIGRPIANIQIYILDARLQPTPLGVEGELHIGGIGLARGYLNQPELTAEKFIPNPFSRECGSRLYKTGDLARFLSTGEIEYLGRIDHQVKIRGHRVELGEIESVIRQFPGIRNVVVVDRDDSSGDKRLVAYLIPIEIESQLASLREFLRKKLPEYMIPAVFVVLADLPLTPNGKIDRKALPPPDQDNTHDPAFIAPRTRTEQLLTTIWAELLNVPKVGIRDNFFDLGGHSLLAVKLLTRIEHSLGKELPLASLLEAATIEEQARLIHRDTTEVSPTNAAQRNDADTTIPFFFLGGDPTFRPLSQHLSAAHEFHSLGLQPSFTRDLKRPYSLERIAEHFVREIRERRPNGPYMLGGWCAHGLLAFEVAQQLKEQKQNVELLIMLETVHPVRRLEYAKWKRYISTIQLKIHLLKFEYAHLRQLPRPQAMNYILGRVKKKASRISQSIREGLGIFRTDLSDSDRQNPITVLYSAVLNYCPKPYEGSVVLFRSLERTFGFAHDLRLGWGQMLGDKLEICQVPGNHYTIYMEPNVNGLAHEMTVRLKMAVDRVAKSLSAADTHS